MLHIALFEPEIPPNTGNLIRLCANMHAQLHLIEPLGFDLDDKRLRRAGLDYHEFSKVKKHPDFDHFLTEVTGQRIFALSTKSKKNYSEVAFCQGDVFLFGPETRGLPEHIRSHVAITDCLIIPMLKDSRSLNLSNSAAIVAYEAWRQLGFIGS